MKRCMQDMRGVMLDPARLTESRAVYRDLIKLCADWGYNTLLWHFSDDHGCAFKFPRRPELAGPHAYSRDEMHELIGYARQHGITVIPEVECFGHTNFITRLPQYRHLADGTKGKLFGALCVFHPDAKKILVDILQDTAETFDAEFIHVGLDEVSFGDNPYSKRLLQSSTKYELFAQHVNWLHSVVTSLGRKTMMWGDHLLPAFDQPMPDFVDPDAINEKIADMIPKDIVMCDWHYNPKPDPRTLDFFLGKGFNVLACPAVSAWGLLGHPRQWNLDNLSDFARIAMARKRRGVLGMINTVWCPFRYFTGTTLYAMALGAAFQRTGGTKPRDFDAQFARATFGLPVALARTTAAALALLHAGTPHMTVLARVLPKCRREIANVTDDDLKALRTLAAHAGKALPLLRAAARQVTVNHIYFNDIVGTAAMLRQIARHGLVLRRIQAGTLSHAALLKEARAADALHAAALALWRATRYADDPKQRHGHDALVARVGYYAQLLRRIARGMNKVTGAAALTTALIK